MKKKITITESELRDIVEGIISELDYRTYLNAAKKADQRAQTAKSNGYRDDANADRWMKFNKAADRSYKNQYLDNGKYFGDTADVDVSLSPYAGSVVYNKGANHVVNYDNGNSASYFNGTNCDHYSYTGKDYAQRFPQRSEEDKAPHLSHYYRRNNGVWNDENYNLDNDKAYISPLYNNQYSNPGLNSLYQYYGGNAQYTPGKGWGAKQQEALVRAVTEAVIRELKRK